MLSKRKVTRWDGVLRQLLATEKGGEGSWEERIIDCEESGLHDQLPTRSSFGWRTEKGLVLVSVLEA